MAELIVLYPGVPATDNPDDPWLPAVALEHVDSYGMGIIVGETAEGYAEGITVETFEAIRAAIITRDEVVKQVGKYLWEELGMENATHHVQAALGMPVDEI